MISAQRKISLSVVLALLALVVASPARADDTPTFYKDQRTGCNVGTFTPEPGLSVRWNGSCQSGLAEGSGTVEWLKNGVSTGRSDGAYHAGLREGLFAITNADGTKSLTDYHNGQASPVFVAVLACSPGTHATTESATLQWTGTCVNAKAEGPGIATLQIGSDYWRRTEATFHAGIAEGRGVTETSAGNRYEAELRDGKMNGRCVMTTPDVRIDGQCANDLLNGPGKAAFKGDGGYYEGDFKDSHITGKGVWVFGNGSRWEGDFLDAKLNGHGREVFPRENESYEGTLLNGKYEGTGTYHFANGGVYEGEWHDGMPNGRGVYHGIPNGLFGMSRDYAGTWVNGCFAQPPLTAALFKSLAACGFNDD
jgi:hypothetical protein